MARHLALAAPPPPRIATAAELVFAVLPRNGRILYNAAVENSGAQPVRAYVALLRLCLAGRVGCERDGSGYLWVYRKVLSREGEANVR